MLIVLAGAYYIRQKIYNNHEFTMYKNMLTDRHYVYFINSGKILRVSKDGRELNYIEDAGYACNFSIYNSKLYYIDTGNGLESPRLCRINTDGTNYETIYSGDIDGFYIDKGQKQILYGIRDNNTVSIYSNNLNLKKETHIIDGASYWITYKNKIYCTFPSNEVLYTLKVYDIKGNFIKELCSIENPYFEISEEHILYQPVSYTAITAEEIIQKIGMPLYSVDIKTGNKRYVAKDKVLYFIAFNNRVYYCTSDKNKSLLDSSAKPEDFHYYSRKFDGSDTKKISKEKISYLVTYCIDGNEIYYIDENNNLMKSSISGGKSEMIVPYEKLQNIK